MKDYKYILFDLDGTITDSKPGIIHCIKYALGKKGISCPEEILDKMVGPPFRVSMSEFLGLDMPMIEELIVLYRGLYEVDGWKNCKIYDGVVEMLDELKSAGKTLAIATSKPMKFTDIMIDGLGLRKYFAFVGGATCDASKESKADVIGVVLENLGVKDKSEVLMVGDRLYDLEGAHQQNVDVAGVLWGYGSREELVEHGAHYLLETPKDVVKLLVGKE